MFDRTLRMALAFSILLVGAGCSHYTTPGGPADFRALGISQAEVEAATDAGIALKMAKKPLASFPTSIATVRVQARGYRSYSLDGWGDGDFTVITVRDIETEEQLEKLTKLPMIKEIVPINRMVITGMVRNERDLRDAAANLHADMLAIYTLDTRFDTSTTVPYLGVITLGLFPNEQASVTATAAGPPPSASATSRYGSSPSTQSRTARGNSVTADSLSDASSSRGTTTVPSPDAGSTSAVSLSKV